jgi:hypothetical protein
MFLGTVKHVPVYFFSIIVVILALFLLFLLFLAPIERVPRYKYIEIRE